MSRLLIAASFLLAAGAPAQPFEPGYVVVEGDTLRGAVALESETQNALGVRFRSTPTATPVMHGVEEASAFGADGGRAYRRARYQTDPSPDAPTGRRLFARVVRDGPVDLLAAETVEGRPTFFVQTDAAPIGLYLVRDEVATESGVRQRERALFRQTLAVVLEGPCAAALDIPTLAYTEPALTDAIDTYNECADPGYTASASRAVRTPIRVRFEGGLDAATGSLERVSEPPGTPDEPALGALRARAALEVAPPFFAGEIRPVLGLEYERDVVRLVTGARGRDVTAYDLLHVRLGVRFAPEVAGGRVRLGAGLLSGYTLDRVVASDVDVDAREDVVRFVDRRDFEASVGQYVEFGLRPAAVPVELAVRTQRTLFTSENPFVAFTGQYEVRSLSAGLTVRL
ncbi:hypothetical protein [Rubrivirga marina]|uniref:Outer membrane protein beta-barrel domain-containing protein n=1 Tax=Rubrivirga marina TaxID=1196024 RepID=A0A271IW21_9BACT|nr:hypothetical protein [Rubrivirga marina]PAP75436.1 hypothetical protein BSZ37_02740 [Rubrivirga marina]